MSNIDPRTAAGFDRIWSRETNGSSVDPQWYETVPALFAGFPLSELACAEGFELGCGSGRVARYVAPLVGFLHCIDPSPAGLAAASASMRDLKNVRFHQASVDAIPLPAGSQDFGYSLGVLHHVPDPREGLRCCVEKLKAGAPFLLYVYYDLENRPPWFRFIWRMSDVGRKFISRLPFPARSAFSTFLAATVYWPLSRTARLLETIGAPIESFPLSFYRRYGWATLRADALDRFGTGVEHRFSKAEVERMMVDCGLCDVHFREEPPFWVAFGYKC